MQKLKRFKVTLTPRDPEVSIGEVRYFSSFDEADNYGWLHDDTHTWLTEELPLTSGERKRSAAAKLGWARRWAREDECICCARNFDHLPIENLGEYIRLTKKEVKAIRSYIVGKMWERIKENQYTYGHRSVVIQEMKDILDEIGRSDEFNQKEFVKE